MDHLYISSRMIEDYNNYIKYYKWSTTGYNIFNRVYGYIFKYVYFMKYKNYFIRNITTPRDAILILAQVLPKRSTKVNIDGASLEVSYDNSSIFIRAYSNGYSDREEFKFHKTSVEHKLYITLNGNISNLPLSERFSIIKIESISKDNFGTKTIVANTDIDRINYYNDSLLSPSILTKIINVFIDATIVSTTWD